MKLSTTLPPHSPEYVKREDESGSSFVEEEDSARPQFEEGLESVFVLGDSEFALSLEVPQSNEGNDVATGPQEVSFSSQDAQATIASTFSS